MTQFEMPKNIQQILMGCIAIGILSMGATFILDAHRGWAVFLCFTFFLLTLSLSGTFFASLQLISGATWATVIRRIPENTVAALPLAGIGILIIAGLGSHSIYEWTHADVVAEDPILQAKEGYLNLPFWIGRLVAYLAIWLILGLAIRSNSKAMDESKSEATKSTLVKLSAGYILVFAYTITFASMDLIMSLDPHWFQTMFPVYSFAGLAYSGTAALIIMLYVVQKHGGLKDVTVEHWHDIGKYQFMFTVFWAYIAFSQHMLTWYANLTEFTYYLEKRLDGTWGIFTYVFWIGHFVIPFIILLSRKIKRTPEKLVKVAWFILFMGFVDVVWMVHGSMHPMIKGWPLGWQELGAFFGVVGLFGYSVLSAYSKGSEVPAGDPELEESIHFHQTH